MSNPQPPTPSELPAEAPRFLEACSRGDVETVRGLLGTNPALVHFKTDDWSHEKGGPGLHAAASRGHLAVVRLLLASGADPNLRDAGDNASALHFAAGFGHVEVVRALLDAGADVHGVGDVHEMEVIGWATALGPPGRTRWEVLPLLLERGARHHIFSAIAVGDPALIRAVVAGNPAALDRRMSRFEGRMTPLHFAMRRQRYDLLDLLIELGAPLEAVDGSAQTALEVAMGRGDREAVSRLRAAGAKMPDPVDPGTVTTRLAALGKSVTKCVTTISVPDIGAALDWYASIGFTEVGRHQDDGVVNWGMVSFGGAELMLGMHGKEGEHDVSLWFYTDQVDELYRLLKARQLTAARAAALGEPSPPPGIEFTEELYEPFYGGREFGIRDLNGYQLFFYDERAVGSSGS